MDFPKGKGPLRIALICAHSHPLGPLGRRDTGGMSVYIREMSRALASMGHHVDLFVGDGSSEDGRQGPLNVKESLQAYFGPNVHWVSVPCGTVARETPEDQMRTAQAFSRAVVQTRNSAGRPFDVVFSHYWLSGLAGIHAAHLLGLPHAVMFHTLSALKTAALGRAVDAPCRLCAERLVAAQSHRVIAATDREREALGTYYAVPQRRVAVVPCGVDVHLFRPACRLTARSRLGLSQDALVFLFVGRLDPVKGLDRVVDAFSRLPRSIPARLVVVGGDPAEEPLMHAFRHRSEPRDLGERVVFSGRVEQHRLREWYAAADALVIASHYESFCLVALEALASGLAVIGPSVGALPELLSQPEAGILLRDNTPEEILRGMLAFRQRWPHETPAAAARRRALAQRYTWDAAARRLVTHFSHMIDEHLRQWAAQRMAPHGFGGRSDYCRTSGRP